MQAQESPGGLRFVFELLLRHDLDLTELADAALIALDLEAACEPATELLRDPDEGVP